MAAHQTMTETWLFFHGWKIHMHGFICTISELEKEVKYIILLKLEIMFFQFTYFSYSLLNDLALLLLQILSSYFYFLLQYSGINSVWNPKILTWSKVEQLVWFVLLPKERHHLPFSGRKMEKFLTLTKIRGIVYVV